MKTGLLHAAAALASLTMLLAAPAALAQDAKKKELTPQQQRMSECSTKSKGMKGAEHEKFMSDCLKGKDAAATAKAPTQQEKMKSCNAEAGKKNLKGDARKTFMSDCLKG